MTPSLVRLATGLAVLAVVGGLSVAAVGAARPGPASLPGGSSGPAPGAARPAPSPTPSGFATLPVDQWPTPDVPDADAVRSAGGNDASLPVPVSGRQVTSGDRPVRLRIPAIGVDTRLVELGIARDGTMEVPADPARAGWLTTAPAPGQRGPAVIAGHVDTHDGPAVFFRLRALRPGARVDVVQRDGDVVHFTVRSARRFAKDAFPTELVYGPQPGPVLRLITCSGEVDPATGHYRDNTVALQAFKAGQFDYWQETSAKNWATAYDIPAVHEGRLIKEEIPNYNPTGMQGFIFNIRRPLLQDRRVREALALLFDFEWTNRQLFNGAYFRTHSYFDNSELASSGLPGKDELAVLEPLRGQIPDEVFEKPFELPVTDGNGIIREQQRRAYQLLTEAGWHVENDRMVDAQGKPVKLEFLLVQSEFERVLLPYKRNLADLGIELE
ncbi:MAG: class F sortase, partial [Micrococcales bacterium]|nr:class F sortase [Micrococcales bacterium]